MVKCPNLPEFLDGFLGGINMGWFDTPEEQNRKDNENYAEGVKEGQNAGWFAGLGREIGEIVTIGVPKSAEYERKQGIRDAGIKYGMDHPARSSDDDDEEDNSSYSGESSYDSDYSSSSSYDSTPTKRETPKSEGSPLGALVAGVLLTVGLIGAAYSVRPEQNVKDSSSSALEQSVEPQSHVVAPIYRAPARAPTPPVAWDKITIYEYSDGTVMQVRENSTGIYMTSRTNNPAKLANELRSLEEDAAAREQTINAQRQINRKSP